MRARLMGAIGAAVLMLAGCGHLPFGHKAVPRGGETITYSFQDASLCGLARCHNYSVTLGPDGQGIFTGSDGRDERFRASSTQTGNFTRALASVRPSGERLLIPGQSGCRQAAADGTTVDVHWQSAELPAVHLRLYSGCASAKARRLNDAVRELPVAILPIADLIGAH